MHVSAYEPEHEEGEYAEEDGPFDYFTFPRIPEPIILNTLDIAINILEAVFLPPYEKHGYTGKGLSIPNGKKTIRGAKGKFGVVVMERSAGTRDREVGLRAERILTSIFGFDVDAQHGTQD